MSVQILKLGTTRCCCIVRIFMTKFFPATFLLFVLFKIFIYLHVNVVVRESERAIHWFNPQMAGPKLEVAFVHPMRNTRAQALGPPSVAFCRPTAQRWRRKGRTGT